MNILIIGGTSFMGPHVARQLNEPGHTVAVFSRGRAETDMLEGCRRITGDRNELGRHKDVLLGFEPEVVIDMICLTEAQAAGVIDVFSGVARRVVMASSCDVYQAYGRLIGSEQGEPCPTPLTEESPLRSLRYPYRSEQPRADDDPERWLDDYDKIPCEQALIDCPGFEAAVVRLPMVYGPGDRQMRLLPVVKRVDDRREAILLDSATAAWRGVRGYSENMARALALAATHPAAANRVYNAGDKDGLTELEWTKAVCGHLAYPGRIVTVDPRELPEELRPAADMRHHLFASTDRIRGELGYAESITRETALERTVVWQRRNMPKPAPPALFNYEAEDKVLAEPENRG